MNHATRMRTKRVGTLTTILVLIKRQMRGAATLRGAAQCIEELSFRCNGDRLAKVYTGQNVTESPLIAITVDDVRAGDTLDVCWRNDQGDTGNAEAIVS